MKGDIMPTIDDKKKNNLKIIEHMKKQAEQMVIIQNMLGGVQNTGEVLDEMQKSIHDLHDQMNDNMIKIFGAVDTETAIRIAPEAIKPRMEKLEKEVTELNKWKNKIFAITGVLGIIAPIVISILINYFVKK